MRWHAPSGENFGIAASMYGSRARVMKCSSSAVLDIVAPCGLISRQAEAAASYDDDELMRRERTAREYVSGRELQADVAEIGDGAYERVRLHHSDEAVRHSGS